MEWRALWSLCTSSHIPHFFFTPQGFSDLDLTLEHRLLLASILIFVFGNALFLTHIFFRSNTLRAYIHKYPIHFYAALIFVFFGVENYSILDTHLFRYPFLYAKWSVPTANLLRVRTVSVV